MAAYGASKSHHDFTQRQLLSCLLLKADLKTTYRGVLEILASSEVLLWRLGLENKLPHHTTLQKFGARSQVQDIAAAILAQLSGLAEAAAGRTGRPGVSAAVDATGLEKDCGQRTLPESARPRTASLGESFRGGLVRQPAAGAPRGCPNSLVAHSEEISTGVTSDFSDSFWW